MSPKVKRALELLPVGLLLLFFGGIGYMVFYIRFCW